MARSRSAMTRGDDSFRLSDNASLELDEMIRFVRQEIAHL